VSISEAPVKSREELIPPERVALVDLLDRLLAGGVVLSGDIVLSISGVDLVQISLRAVIASIHGQTTESELGSP
jgi:hypothetical protein